ncbi:Leucine Rich repeats (2 copies) [Gimesia aquarii]|uniref:Leucine Rich repeats (2 copies) n=1 Tax=Gimesia aquarii TaxID=2527964 RepID=A0A517VRU6_9PLAN|nr:Leucine Rich repeats (2 copies) [Gimesia aquarii]
MYNNRIFDGIRKLKHSSSSWFKLRNALVLLVLAVVIYFAPLVFQRGRLIVLAETIRSHGGEVYFANPLCAKGYCLKLPLKLNDTVGAIYYISYQSSEDYPINDEFIDSLGNQPHLRHLYLGSEKQPSTITDHGLAKLSKYPLEILSIAGGSFTDSGLNVLEKIPTLKCLILRDLDFSGDQFQCAPTLKNLKSLHFSDLSITDTGLANLASLPNLDYLDLNKAVIDGDGLRHLSKSKNLVCVNIDNSVIKADSLNHLIEVKSLRYLSLKGKATKDEHVRQVSNVNQLTFLMLNDSEVTDQGLIPLTNIKNLHHLFLTNTHITDAGIKNLIHSPSLTKLELSNTLITDQVKESLLHIPKLSKVNVSGTKLSSVTIQSLRDSGIEVMTSKPGYLH